MSIPAAIRLVRPRQWPKNLLVLSAPALAGALTSPDVLAATLLALAAFLLASAGTYAINDTFDAERDRLHPTKRMRPVAAGEVTPTAALALGGVLTFASIVVAVLAGAWLWAVIVAYLLVTFGYSTVLKHIVLVDVLVVAFGFLLRAVAGAAATGVAVSAWFGIFATFGALFVATGKRFSEALSLGEDAAEHREALAHYPPLFAEFMLSTSAAAMMMSYGLWAFDRATDSPRGVLLVASIAPMVIFVLRYAQQTFAGNAGSPERLIIGDKALLGLGVAVGMLVGIGIAL